MKKSNIRQLILCALLTSLIAVGAFIKIPFFTIPMTLQLTFVLLSGFLLGSKWGTVSVLVYLSLGLIGIPVFTSGGGPSYVLKPTFGYLLGFVLCSFIVGKWSESSGKHIFVKYLLIGLSGVLSVYLVALPYLSILSSTVLPSPISLDKLFFSYFLIFLPTDLLQCLLASFLAMRLSIVLKKKKELS